MAAYISYVFEKDKLTAAPIARVITRNRDDGDVPPVPSTIYYPTSPDELREFIVGQYLNDSLGDTFVRIATLADITNYSVLELDTFEDASASPGFITAGVLPGDVLEVSTLDPEYWTSDEYPSGNPFPFTIGSVISETKLTVLTPFPSFTSSLTWTIPVRSISGTAGITRRNGSPAILTYFRTKRYARRFIDAVAAENYIAATKADIDALVAESVGSSFVDETLTAGSAT